MGKHNKVNRKNYWKRRKRRFTGRGNKEQCSSTCSKEEQNHGGLESDFDHADNDSEDQTGHSLQNYLDTSDNGSEYQNDHSLENSLIPSVNDSEGQNVNVADELTACSTDNESEHSDKCLDLNDPKVIKFFDQPKPTEDPLWVNMFVYQRHKRKLLKLLRNPLGVKY